MNVVMNTGFHEMRGTAQGTIVFTRRTLFVAVSVVIASVTRVYD